MPCCHGNDTSISLCSDVKPREMSERLEFLMRFYRTGLSLRSESGGSRSSVLMLGCLVSQCEMPSEPAVLGVGAGAEERPAGPPAALLPLELLRLAGDGGLQQRLRLLQDQRAAAQDPGNTSQRTASCEDTRTLMCPRNVSTWSESDRRFCSSVGPSEIQLVPV